MFISGVLVAMTRMTGEYPFIFLSKLYGNASKNRHAFVMDKQNDGSVAREVVIFHFLYAL